MKPRALHQVLVGATAGDAITDHALMIQRWLRADGYESDIFAEHIHPSMADRVRPFARYRPRRREPWLIFHHSVGDPMVAQVTALSPRLILIYHNITPARYFAGIDPAWVHRARLGEQQLARLQPRADLALAVSDYNAADLRAAGFDNVAVLPLPLDAAPYQGALNETLAADLRAHPGPLLLFVGRLAPNKRQEDLLKLLFYLRRLRPTARLALVGDPWVMGYGDWLRGEATRLGMGDALLLPGKVLAADLVTYYRCADWFVSMSEHEGFGKPLVECMAAELPVLAFAAGAVPATLGDAGILFHHKHYPALAELIHLLLDDAPLRRRLIARQRQRLPTFLEPAVRRAWNAHLADVISG
ncbi:MAG: glycosyltransferase family 4 protein [Ardenticatenales bacterium]|nr:glycosyltransferase family 4 protein [Ardenticatenales bacterium]